MPTLELKDLHNLTVAFLDLEETIRAVLCRPPLPGEIKPYLWLLDTWEEPAIQREYQQLPAARQEYHFTLLQRFAEVAGKQWPPRQPSTPARQVRRHVNSIRRIVEELTAAGEPLPLAVTEAMEEVGELMAGAGA